YRFPEDIKLKGDPDNFRFNFRPCFAFVGNQFIASSTFGLCRELIDLLEKEQEQGTAAGSNATIRSQLYASGGVRLLETFKDRLLTQTMLNQALSPEQAAEQVRAFLSWVDQLGVLQVEEEYGAREFHYDLGLRWKKSTSLSRSR